MSRVSFWFRLKYPTRMLKLPSVFLYQPSNAPVTLWPVSWPGSNGNCSATNGTQKVKRKSNHKRHKGHKGLCFVRLLWLLSPLFLLIIVVPPPALSFSRPLPDSLHHSCM